MCETGAERRVWRYLCRNLGVRFRIRSIRFELGSRDCVVTVGLEDVFVAVLTVCVEFVVGLAVEYWRCCASALRVIVWNRVRTNGRIFVFREREAHGEFEA